MSDENTTYGITAQEVSAVIPGAVTAVDVSDSIVYNTSGQERFRLSSNGLGIGGSNAALQISNNSNINHCVIFHGPKGKEVGRFDFSDGDFKFEGDASGAAKVFTEWCRKNWSDLRAKDKHEVLQQVLDDLMQEASGELYSEEEKVAILTCMQRVQERKLQHEAPHMESGYAQNLAKSMTATKEAVAGSLLSAIAPEGKSL